MKKDSHHFKWTALVVLLTVATFVLSLPSYAHNPFLMPSSSAVNGKDAWVNVDAAVCSSLFHFDTVSLKLQGLKITAPDGSDVQATNLFQGQLKNSFDVQTKQVGTYTMSVLTNDIFVSYKIGAEDKRWRGSLDAYQNDFLKNLDKLAVITQVSQMQHRVQTFVTNVKPSAIALSNQGVELKPITHPTDLVENEKAVFQLLVDGKPVAGLDVAITLGASRYRHVVKEKIYTTDKEGKITVQWQGAGMYYVAAKHKDSKVSIKEAKERQMNYYATLEVLPE